MIWNMAPRLRSYSEVADDSVTIDTSFLSIDAAVQRAIDAVEARCPSGAPAPR